MSRTKSVVATLAAAALACVTGGCESFTGPGIHCVAPRVTGRIVDDATDAPIAWARVAREPRVWRGPLGDLPKGAEEQMARSTWVRTGRDGRFELPATEVALLFGFGDTMPNLRLVIDHAAYRRLDTNFNSSDLKMEEGPPSIEAGTLRLERK